MCGKLIGSNFRYSFGCVVARFYFVCQNLCGILKLILKHNTQILSRANAIDLIDILLD